VTEASKEARKGKKQAKPKTVKTAPKAETAAVTRTKAISIAIWRGILISGRRAALRIVCPP